MLCVCVTDFYCSNSEENLLTPVNKKIILLYEWWWSWSKFEISRYVLWLCRSVTRRRTSTDSRHSRFLPAWTPSTAEQTWSKTRSGENSVNVCDSLASHCLPVFAGLIWTLGGATRTRHLQVCDSAVCLSVCVSSSKMAEKNYSFFNNFELILMNCRIDS